MAWTPHITYLSSVPRPVYFQSGSERDYIGFATLPEQVHRKSVKRGFEFTLLVVGESGLGKSTLVNSLFLSDLYSERVVPDVSGEWRGLRSSPRIANVINFIGQHLFIARRKELTFSV